jgi:hypothetical protein
VRIVDVFELAIAAGRHERLRACSESRESIQLTRDAKLPVTSTELVIVVVKKCEV